MTSTSRGNLQFRASHITVIMTCYKPQRAGKSKFLKTKQVSFTSRDYWHTAGCQCNGFMIQLPPVTTNNNNALTESWDGPDQPIRGPGAYVGTNQKEASIKWDETISLGSHQDQFRQPLPVHNNYEKIWIETNSFFQFIALAAADTKQNTINKQQTLLCIALFPSVESGL